MAARHRLAAALVTALAAVPAAAQQQGDAPPQTTFEVPSPVLTIDQDRLFQDSAWGRRVQQEIEAASAELAAENRRIESELVAEENDLTERRPSLPADQFKAAAAAFDEKVQRLRSEQDAKTRELTQRREQERQAFYKAVIDVLSEVVRDRGAVAILDRRAIFLASQAIDITDESIARIDAAIGDGSDVDPLDGAPAAAGDGQGAGAAEAPEGVTPGASVTDPVTPEPGETAPLPVPAGPGASAPAAPAEPAPGR